MESQLVNLEPKMAETPDAKAAMIPGMGTAPLVQPSIGTVPSGGEDIRTKQRGGHWSKGEVGWLVGWLAGGCSMRYCGIYRRHLCTFL